MWLEKLPFLGLAAAFAVLAVNAKASVGTLTSLAQHGPLARLVQACYGVVFYLVKTVVPTGLSPIYEIRLPLRLGEPRFVASVVVVVLLAAGTLLLWRRRRAVSLAAFAYVLLLSPVLGFGQAGNQLAADRYATQAAIPLALLAAAGLAVWLRAAPRRAGGAIVGDRRGRRPGGAGGALDPSGAGSGTTRDRSGNTR